MVYKFLKKFKIRNEYGREFFAEFWGTFILVLIGDAAFAQTILTGNNVSDVLAVVFGWAIAVLLGITVSGGVSGGHINPVVTFTLATIGKLNWRKVPVYIAAQYLGAFAASVVLFANYHDLLFAYDGGKRTVTGPIMSGVGTGRIWATYPRRSVSLGTVFLDGLVATGLFMFTLMAIIDTKNLKTPKWMYPYSIGLMVSAVALGFGPNTMTPLNPARDFAPRVFTAMAGWGSATFSPLSYNYWWVAGIVAPHLGGLIGGWLYYLCVELHWPDVTPDSKDHTKSEENLRRFAVRSSRESI